MIKLTLKIFLLFALVVVLIIIGISSGIINISKIESNSDSAQKIFLSRIEGLGNIKLITFNLNYVIKDTIRKDTSDVGRLLTSGKVLAIINGEVDACINLTRIDENDIKEDKDTAFISLPMPVLCGTKINYERSIIYDMNFSSKVPNQNIIDKYFPNTMNNLKAEAIRLGILEQSKGNAIQVLNPVIKGIIKKNIVLKFEED